MIAAAPSRALLLTAAALLLVTGCSRMTEENRQKIKNGMTVDEVKAILGSPTLDETSAPLDVVTLTVFRYKSGDDEVKVRFVNGKVTSVDGDFKK